MGVWQCLFPWDGIQQYWSCNLEYVWWSPTHPPENHLHLYTGASSLNPLHFASRSNHTLPRCSMYNMHKHYWSKRIWETFHFAFWHFVSICKMCFPLCFDNVILKQVILCFFLSFLLMTILCLFQHKKSRIVSFCLWKCKDRVTQKHTFLKLHD